MGEPLEQAPSVIGFAMRAAGEGLSANRFLSDLREAGLGVRRAVGLQVYGEARRLIAEYGQEATRPKESVPTFNETRPFPTRDKTGIIQTVQVFTREAVTGNVITHFVTIKSEGGITRQEAEDRAIDSISTGSNYEQETVIGAMHTGAARLVAQQVA